MRKSISRRQFSSALGRGALALGSVSVLELVSQFSLAASAVSSTPTSEETETLAQLAYFLLPVLEPTHPRYRMVADRVVAQASQVPPIAGLVSAGIAALNEGGEKPWLTLSPAEREKVVGTLAGTPFFGFMRFTSSEVVMREPTLWQRLGYQGSAIEHGGYLHRGFDDIDWLPKPGEAK